MLGLAYFVVLLWSAVIIYLLAEGYVLNFFRQTALVTSIPREIHLLESTVDWNAFLNRNLTNFPLLEEDYDKPLLVVATAQDSTHLWTNDSNPLPLEFSSHLNRSMEPCGTCFSHTHRPCHVRSVEGYYLANDSMARNTFMSLDKLTSVMVVNLCKKRNALAQAEGTKWARDKATEVIGKYSGQHKLNDFPFALHTLDETRLLQESENRIRSSLACYEHLFTVPVAFLLLAYVVGPLVGTLFFTIPTSFLVIFSILDAVQMHNMVFASFLPPIFVALMVALSLNYTLFLLARFHEENEHPPLNEAVATAVKGTGRSILTSTLLLATAFGSLLILNINTKFEVIRALGLGCVVTVLVVSLVSLTLLPSLVIIIAAHCRSCSAPCFPLKCSTWFRSSTCSTYFSIGIRKPTTILGLALLLTSPMIVLIAFGRTSVDQMQLLCLGSPSLVPYNILEKSEFRLGVLSGTVATLQANATTRDPFNDDDLDELLKSTVEVYHPTLTKSNITCHDFKDYCKNGLVLPQFGSDSNRIGRDLMWRSCLRTCNESIPGLSANFSRDNILSSDFFQNTHAAVKTFVKRKKKHEDWRGVRSIAHHPYNISNALSLESALQFIRNNVTDNFTAAAALYRKRYLQNTSPRGHAALVDLKLPFDPFGGETESWFMRVSQKVDPMEVWSPIGGRVNMVASIMNAFWEVLGYVLLLLTLATAICFQSVLLPLRLLFTVAFTVIWTFGSCFLIFQIICNFRGLSWILLPGVAPAVMGLTLDYDVFLITRVIDLRKRGFSTKTSLYRAGKAANKTICAAGLLMAIAFSSLLFTDVWLLREFGFVLVCGTLLDAFFVRPVLVPALMLVLNEDCHWWPRQMPPVSQADDIDLLSEPDVLDRSEDLESGAGLGIRSQYSGSELYVVNVAHCGTTSGPADPSADSPEDLESRTGMDSGMHCTPDQVQEKYCCRDDASSNNANLGDDLLKSGESGRGVENATHTSPIELYKASFQKAATNDDENLDDELVKPVHSSNCLETGTHVPSDELHGAKSAANNYESLDADLLKPHKSSSAAENGTYLSFEEVRGASFPLKTTSNDNENVRAELSKSGESSTVVENETHCSPKELRGASSPLSVATNDDENLCAELLKPVESSAAVENGRQISPNERHGASAPLNAATYRTSHLGTDPSKDVASNTGLDSATRSLHEEVRGANFCNDAAFNDRPLQSTDLLKDVDSRSDVGHSKRRSVGIVRDADFSCVDVETDDQAAIKTEMLQEKLKDNVNLVPSQPDVEPDGNAGRRGKKKKSKAKAKTKSWAKKDGSP